MFNVEFQFVNTSIKQFIGEIYASLSSPCIYFLPSPSSTSPVSASRLRLLRRAAIRFARASRSGDGDVAVLPADDDRRGLSPWCNPSPSALQLPSSCSRSSDELALEESGCLGELLVAFDDSTRLFSLTPARIARNNAPRPAWCEARPCSAIC